MAFDASKDEKLDSRVVEGDNDTFIELSLVRYDGGDVKVQLSRYTEDDETKERKYRRLGRLTIREARAIPGAIGSLLDELEPDSDSSE